MCLFPRNAFLKKYIDLNGEFKQRLVFNRPLNGSEFEEMQIPCGKCYECLMQYTNEWSYRIMNELSFHDGKGCFITLTYKNNPVNLVKRDLQLFLKRLRRKLEPLKIRYFACGEYGSKNLRPHFHLVIFGWQPNDLVFLKNLGKYDIFKSKFIADIWDKGYISVANLTIEVSRYVAKYMQKLQEKEIKKRGLVLPFTTMSNRPGIGYNWFIENYQCLDTDKIWYNGNYIKLPRYYLKVAEQNFDYAKVSNIKNLRKVKSDLFKKDYKQLKIKRDILLSKGLTIS